MRKSKYPCEETARLKKDQIIFQKILRITTDGFLVVDPEGYIMYMNNAYCDYLGLKEEDVIGKYVTEIIKNSKLPEIIKTGKTDVNVLHKLVKNQSPTQEKAVVVTRAPVKEGDNVIAAVGQVKFSKTTMEIADKLRDLDRELEYYKKELKRIASSRYSFQNMIGESKKFIDVKRIAEKAAKNDFSVLILGETGTGKEVFANAIHYGSKLLDKPFIRVNCAAIPSELLESELFGYEEGSFTGAKKGGKKGKFELADSGTIFLDEIGDMPMNMQAKILRVLQEKEVERVGGQKSIPVNVRVIAATNQDLEKKINENTFRLDLYYRLNVIQLNLPPLRERGNDINLYMDYFLNELNEKYETKIGITQEARDTLRIYSWPGNIRELKNAMERAYCLVDGDMIMSTHLPANIISSNKTRSIITENKNLDKIMNEIERELLLNVLKQNNYNCRHTAQELGIHRSTLYKKFEKLNINIDIERN